MIEMDIKEIDGVGPKRAASLSRLGIHTVSDFLHTAPIRYEDRRRIFRISDLEDGDRGAIRVIPTGTMSVKKAASGKLVCTQRFSDGSGFIDGIWFHAPFLRNAFRRGQSYILYGKMAGTGARRHMFAPIFESAASQEKTGRIVPVYPLSAGLTQTFMQKTASACLSLLEGEIAETLPAEILENANILDKKTCFRLLHAPESEADYASARKRLQFEELFSLFLGIEMQKKRLKTKKGLPLYADADSFFNALPFAPTAAQRRVVGEVFSDMQRDVPMNRLVEGDVGSGKTVVAAAALYAAVCAGMQGLLMVPTEILARQHAQTLKKLLPHEEICLLTGQLSASQKRAALSDIASGRARVIVGTQALLSKNVTFSRVAVVCVDEQHRFGVRQRGFLEMTGEAPHVLVMSATPIPRTLSLTLYGDLDISVLDARPAGRQAVDTFAVLPALRNRVHSFLEKELKKGNSAFVVCPRAETEEEGVLSVTAYADALARVLPPDSVLCLHGKMKEKDLIMADFASGKPRVLVATTVIEVGVDVPRATVMVVENAERFGLAQLHQLRGRVGRGKEKAYCILISDARTKESRERLSAMRRMHDGFQIAEADLRLRGPGEFFGTRQHGLPFLRFADPAADPLLLESAQKAAKKMAADETALNAYPHLLAAVEKMYTVAGN